MRPGKLRHRIEIQRPVETRNAVGGVTVTWETFARVWAKIEPYTGREPWAGTSEQQSRVNTRIYIRYLRDITSKMRILFGIRIYDIIAVIDIEEMHREMKLMCEEWAIT